MIYDVEVVWNSTFDPVFVWEKGNEKGKFQWSINDMKGKSKSMKIVKNLSLLVLNAFSKRRFKEIYR